MTFCRPRESLFVRRCRGGSRIVETPSCQNIVFELADDSGMLQNVPVFDDLAVIIETEDIDAGPVAVSWPLLIAVQDDELTIGQHPPKTRRASPVLGEAR